MRHMIPTENIEIKPDGQMIINKNGKGVSIGGEVSFGPEAPEQSVKKIYCHAVYYQCTLSNRIFNGYTYIFTNSATPIDADAFKNYILAEGAYILAINGKIQTDSATMSGTAYNIAMISRYSATAVTVLYRDSSNGIATVSVTVSSGTWTVTDLGPINLN